MERFLSEEGCPKLNAEEKVLFPYLDVSGLDEDDKIDLEYRLESETKKMIFCFSMFTADVIRSLEYWQVPLEKVKHSILSLNAFTHNIAVKLLDEKDKQEIKDAKTYSDIFIALGDYISFFNYQIVEYIIYQHGATKDHERLEEYVQQFHSFCQRSIFEVPQSAFNSSSRKTAKVFALKCTEGVATMKGVVGVIREIANVFGLRPSVLQLCSIKKGCVELHFLISAAVADCIYPVSARQHSALSEIGVKALSCEDVRHINREETK